MRTLISICSVIALTFALGCGGGDGDDGGAKADAAGPTFDAGPDAMQGPTPIASGLGQICDDSTPCVANNTSCAMFGTNTTGMCIMGCAQDLVVTTSATGTVPVPTDASLHAICSAGYADVGTPGCIIIAGGNLPAPPASPLPSTEYTVDLACGIVCVTDTMACPGGLTCSSGICLP
jgi:hypothetical protein